MIYIFWGGLSTSPLLIGAAVGIRQIRSDYRMGAYVYICTYEMLFAYCSKIASVCINNNSVER
jgi:hypothetical protein